MKQTVSFLEHLSNGDSYGDISYEDLLRDTAVHVICMEEDREKLEEIIFRETTTIGIRRQNMDRTVLRRTKKTVQTPYGEAEVKICEKDGLRKVYPEYESVTRLCKESGATFQDVFESVKHSAGETIKTV